MKFEPVFESYNVMLLFWLSTIRGEMLLDREFVLVRSSSEVQNTSSGTTYR